MLGIFKKNNQPQCPIDEATRVWMEDAFIWLINQFGEKQFYGLKIVTPTEDNFPIKFDGTQDSVMSCAKIIARQMNIDNDKVNITFYNQQTLELGNELGNAIFTQQYKSEGYSSGIYMGTDSDGRFAVAIERNQMTDPAKLIATIAHEYSHIKILGEGRLKENDEYLTDLTTVFWGLGIFTANTSFNYYTSFNSWAYDSQGYFTQQEWGYALALYSYIKNEDNPIWLNYLSKNIKSDFNKSIEYIHANTDKVLV